MLTGVDVATALVVTLKLAVVPPGATVTLAGTPAAGLLLESVTCAPPAGAGPFSVTVPAEGLPPVTLAGLRASEDGAAGGPAATRTMFATEGTPLPLRMNSM